MIQVQVEQKTYQMPPQEGFTVAHFLSSNIYEPCPAIICLDYLVAVGLTLA
jgi:hypothetical protein